MLYQLKETLKLMKTLKTNKKLRNEKYWKKIEIPSMRNTQYQYQKK